MMVGGVFWMMSRASTEQPRRHPPVKEEGKRQEAPDFALKDINGRTVRLSDYRGKVILLDFWATWCGPCKMEIPWFMEFERKYKDRGFAVLGVSMDDDAKPVKRFLQKQALDYPVVMGDVPLGQLYGGVLGLPLTYLIDLQGQIVGRYQGETNLTAIESQIKALLPRRKN